MLLYQVLACTVHGKKSYKNIRYKISGSTWTEKSELPNGSFPLSDIQDYIDYFIKKKSYSDW